MEKVNEKKKEEEFRAFTRKFSKVSIESIKSQSSRFQHVYEMQKQFNQDISFDFQPDQSEKVLNDKYLLKYTQEMIKRQREKKRSEKMSENYRVMA